MQLSFQKPQVDSNTKTYTMSTLHQIEVTTIYGIENHFTGYCDVQLTISGLNFSTFMHLFQQQLDISILPLDSDGNLVGQPVAESDSTGGSF